MNRKVTLVLSSPSVYGTKNVRFSSDWICLYLFLFLRSFLILYFIQLCRCIAYRFTKISSSKESATTKEEEEHAKQQMQRKND